jgi:hypothetical protein
MFTKITQTFFFLNYFLYLFKKEAFKIGSSHNRAPMPFNKEVGSSIIYQSAKAANWQPGDYTKFGETARN